jgi:protein disulfide-isomerase
MNLKTAIYGAAFFIGMSVMTVSSANTPKTDLKNHSAKYGAPWFNGNVEEAFALAKKENRSIFLYWGAVWCPPCNYLKSQVFDAPRFAEVMEPTVAVYLDGDTESAQEWGAKFNAAGYPTIILFNSNGDEKLRLDAAMTFAEFATSLKAAITDSASLATIVARAAAGKATPTDWKLIVGVNWSDIDEKIYPSSKHMQDRLQMFSTMPKSMAAERAKVAASLIDSARSAGGKEELKTVFDAISTEKNALFDALFADNDAIRAAREPIAYLQTEYLTWYSDVVSIQKTAMITKWKKAHETLRSMKDLPVDIHMGATMGDINLFKLAQKDQPIPEPLKESLRAAVAAADRTSTSEHQRIATIPSAAYYLQEIGDFAGARSLLDKELKTTKVPWYYHSTYAGVEKAAGNDTKALYWASEAKKSAQGRASKIQWMFSEISLVNRIETKDKEQQLARLIDDYFETALSFADGFTGRNATRMQSLEKILKPLQSKKVFADLTAKHAKSCLKSAARAECSTYFAALTNTNI